MCYGDRDLPLDCAVYTSVMVTGVQGSKNFGAYALIKLNVITYMLFRCVDLMKFMCFL